LLVARLGHRPVHGHLQAPGDHQGFVLIHDLAQHGELVAAEPGDEILAAEGLFEPPGDPPQQLVAGVMAEAVVDHLEPVEVEEHQCHLAAALSGQGQ
jgi:hypothetical protein